MHDAIDEYSHIWAWSCRLVYARVDSRTFETDQSCHFHFTLFTVLKIKPEVILLANCYPPSKQNLVEVSMYYLKCHILIKEINKTTVSRRKNVV